MNIEHRFLGSLARQARNGKPVDYCPVRNTLVQFGNSIAMEDRIRSLENGISQSHKKLDVRSPGRILREKYNPIAVYPCDSCLIRKRRHLPLREVVYAKELYNRGTRRKKEY